MICRETKSLLNAYMDGELDSAGSLSIESHVQGCASCQADLERLRAVTSAIQTGSLRFQASPRLRRNVQAAIRHENPTKAGSFWNWRWATALGTAVVVIVLGWAALRQWTGSSEETRLVNDIVASHVRSMMANHITDVASSDSHTVKPWFAGKLDYTPPTTDLTEQGFRLIGGRLDYLNDRPVGALVYQRNQHLINLFVWPSNGAVIGDTQLTRQGYNLIHWTKAGMTYWLVSELNPTELNECARLLKE